MSYFIGGSYSSHDGSQNYLPFQPVFKSFKIFTGTIDKIFGWKSWGLLEQSITIPATPSNDIAPRLNYINNAKVQVKFDGSCLKRDKVSFNHWNVVKFFIVYELHIWSYDKNTDLTLKDCLFGAAKQTKNSDPDKYYYSGYGVEFISESLF